MKQDKNDDVLAKAEVTINIYDFFIVIAKHKKLILTIMLIAGLSSTIYHLIIKDHSLPKVMYRSECIIRIDPSDQNNIDGTNLDSMTLRMKSNELLNSAFSKCQMQNNGIKNVRQPFSSMIRSEVVNAEANRFRISVETADPQLSQNILICFISELSNYLKDNTIESLEARKSLLRSNIDLSNDVNKKQQYAEQIISIDKQIKAITTKDYYTFDLYSPPSAPREYYQGFKSADPMLLTVFIMFVSSILAITLSFILEYLHYLKAKEPEKLWHLKKILRFRAGKFL